MHELHITYEHRVIAMTQDHLTYLAHKALNIRIDSLRATTQAASGHPTSCLSSADIISVLFFHVLKYDYKNPKYHNNDRFILSKGHSVPVLYAALHQLGVITEQELLSYRRIDSDFEGHPTPRLAYNEAATGSLGQGLAVGLGMALNARYEGLSYRTYVMIGDGEQAEGSVWEAAELAAYYRVDNLVGILDCNRLGQSDTALHDHNVERYAQKFQAFGWKTFVIDGHNLAEIVETFKHIEQVKDQPTMIIAKTVKGYGIEQAENKLGYHGKPFKKDELVEIIKQMRQRFGFAEEQPEHNAPPYQLPVMMEQKSSCMQDNITLDITADPAYAFFAQGKKISTRKAFGHALAHLGSTCDRVFALDADVKNSTYTEFLEQEKPHQFIQCFIAEQNMVSVSTGLALRGKIPFASTFACFFARCYDQVRMAGIGRVPLRLCGSHSGVSIGQDGPSQMGLEDLAMMRAIPQSIVLWPSDGISTYKLVEQMANYNDGVSYMKSTRADTPILYDIGQEFPIGGSKVLRSSGNDQVCIVTAGITVHEALAAYEQLDQEGIKVSLVDLYSIKPLDVKSLLSVAATSNNTILTVEDHYQEGGLGEAVVSALRNTGIKIQSLAVQKLPRSGSPEELMKFEGIDAEHIVKAVKTIKA